MAGLGRLLTPQPVNAGAGTEPQPHSAPPRPLAALLHVRLPLGQHLVNPECRRLSPVLVSGGPRWPERDGNRVSWPGGAAGPSEL